MFTVFKHGEDTTRGSWDYREHRIHWTRGMTISELTRYYWVVGLVGIATEIRVVIYNDGK